jgi:hypothetical protein
MASSATLMQRPFAPLFDEFPPKEYSGILALLII